MNSTLKTCYLAALAAVGGISIASGVRAFTAPSAGQMALWVNTATGDVTLVGNGTVFSAYGATSSGNNIVSANFLKPMNSMDSWSVLSSTGGYISEGRTPSQSNVTINSTGSQTAGATTGPVNLGNIFNTTLDAQDLSFHWDNGSGAYELGTIQYGSLGVATQTWAPGGVDGSGNWDTSTNNWNPGPTTWSNNNAAVFGLGGSTSETVTIDTTGITASGLTFNAMGSGASYTIAGTITDDLTLTNSSGVLITMNANATISAPIHFSNDLQVSGGHILTISGGTYFNGNTVQIGDGGAVTSIIASGGGGNGPSAITLESGFLETGGGHGPTFTSTDNGSVAATNTFDLGGNTTTFMGTGSQLGRIFNQSTLGDTVVLQDGTIQLATTTAATDFTHGTLQIGNGSLTTILDFGYNSSNNLPASGVTIALDEATLTQASTNDNQSEPVDISANTISNAMTLTGANTINTGTLYNLTIAGNITDGKSPGSLTVNGDGTSTFNVILTGTDTYSGGTTIPTNQTLEIGSGGTTGSITGNVADNGGVLAFSRSDSITFGGVISGTNGVLEQDGNGTLTLTGANTYTGNTVNNGTGTLAIGVGGSITDSAQVVLQGTNSVFDISAGGNQTIKKLLGNTGTSVNLGGNTLTEGAGGSSTFAGGITGTGGLTVAGTSTVFTLTAANLYSGATTISAGDTLALSGSGIIQNSSGISVTSGATFDISQISGGGTIVQGLSGAGTVALGGKGLAEDGAGTFSGVIQDGGIGGGSGGYLNKNSAGTTLTLSGANTYTGHTLINGGTLALSGSGSIADSSSLTVQPGTTFDISQTTTGATINDLGGSGTVALGSKILTLNMGTAETFSGIVNGTGGSIVKNGSGAMTLSGANTYTGGTTVNAGTLVAGNNNAVGTGALTVNTGSMLETTGAQAGSGATVHLNAGSYTQSAGGTLALLATSSTNYDSIDLGSGAATLNGELNLIFSGFTPTSGQVYKVVQTTASESSSDNFSNIVLTNAGSLHAIANFLSGTGEEITLTSVPTLYWTGSSSGTALADANGNWDTTGGNTVWSSAATSGTAQVWTNGDIASFGADTSAAVTVTLDQANVTAAGITFNPMLTGGSYTIAASSGDNLALNGTITMNANATISAPIVGTGAVTITGPDTLTLSGTNTYTGGTTIEGGTTVNFSNAAAFGTSTVTIGTGGGTLQYGLASLTLGNNLALIGNGTIDTNGLGDPSSGVTLAGNITGSANLTINSSVAGGELYLTGSNGSFTGNTTLENGVEVGIGTGTAFGSGTITIGTGGGTVEYDAAVSVNNSLVLSNAGAGINMHDEAGTWAGVISGTNSLLIHDTLGGGSLTLTNSNTYSGITTIGLGNAVTLALSGSGSIADSSAVSIASGGTFDISATANGTSIVSLGGVSGSAVALGGQTLTITNAATGANGTFGGVISGTGGGLTLSAGTEILSGVNTYTGLTTISGGTLEFTGDTSSLTGNVVDNAILDFAQTANSSMSGAISGSGTVVEAGGTGTTLTFTGTNTYTGVTTISSGTLALSGSGSIAASSGVSVASGAKFDISQSSGGVTVNGLTGSGGYVYTGAQTLTVNVASGTDSFGGYIYDRNGINNVSGGGLTKTGTGTLLLTGFFNNYTGATTISAGTLAVSATTSDFDLSSDVSVAAGATLDISAYSGETANAISGAGTIYLGSTSLGIFGTSGTYVFSGVIKDGGLNGGTGGSILKYNGSSTLVLSGANTYTGGTTLSAGTLVAGNANAFGTGALTVNGGTLETTGAQAGSGSTIGLHASGYTQSASGILALLATSSTNYDAIDLGSGAATLNGELNLIFSGFTPTAGQVYKIVQTTATELSSDNFSNILLTGAGSLGATANFVNGTGEEITLTNVPTLYWTGSTTGTALADTNGNWDTTGGNTVWSSAATGGTAQVWTNGDIASLGAGGTSAVTVTIDQSGVSSSGIIFNAMGTGGSYTIASGGAGDNLALNGTITMNANATISAPIIGTGALTIGGTNTLTLSSLGNTYSGGTTINSGATLDVTGVITGAVADNGTFDVNDGFGITDLTGSGAMALATSVGLSINPTAADVFSGTLTGDSSTLFAVAGADSLTLTGNLSGYAGTFKALGGVLTLNASGTLNSSATLEVANNGTLNVAYSNLFGNVAAFSGNTTNGFLNFIGTGANGTLGNGALLISIADTTGTTTNTIDGGGSANTLTIASPIQSANTGSGGSNTLVLQNGTFILASTNNVSDFIDNGTLQIGNNAGPESTVEFTAATNLPGSSIGINMEGGELQFTGSGAVTVANTITDTASNDIIDGGGSGNTVTLNNFITNAAGSTLTVQDGTFVLGASNSTTFSGGSLQIGNGSIGGIVDFGAASNLPGSDAGIALGKGTLDYTGSSSVTLGNAIIVSTGSSNTIDANTQQLTLSNSITNTGGTLILQNGTFVLTGANNGTGEFTGGTLQIGNGTLASTVQFAAGTNLPGSGATIAMDVGTLTFTGAITDSNSSTVTLTGANTINTGTGGDLTLFGNITDGSSSGSLTVNGDGTSNKILYCAGAVSYTGTTTITGGTLEFGGDTSGLAGNITDNAALAFLQTADSSISGIISGTGSVTQQGSATLTLSGANTYAGATTITSGTLELTGNTSGLTGGIVNDSALVFAQASNSSFGQVISGTGSVTQQGSATLTLSAANTYSGNTTVASGATLNITGSLYQGSGHGNILDNGTMDVTNGFTVGSLTGTGTLDLTNTGSPLIVTLSSIFGGAVTGDGELEASGTGITLTLNGSLAGFTGNLLAANGGNILVGTGAGQLSGSVNLDITNNLSISLSYGTLAGAGNAVNFTGNTTTAGELFVTGTGTGTLGAIDIADTTGTTTNTIDGGGATNTLTLAGAITSAGAGSNTLILQNGTFALGGTNDSSFTAGALQIGNGSLASVAQISSAGNLPGSGVGITLDKGTLAFTGTGSVITPIAVGNAISLMGSGETSVLSAVGYFQININGTITNPATDTLAFSSTLSSNAGYFILNDSETGTGTFQIGDAPVFVDVSNANAFGSGAVLLSTGSVLYIGANNNISAHAASYTQQAASTLGLFVTSSGNSSIALGGGTAALAGTLNMIFESGSNPAKGDIYDVITTSGTVSGNFSSVVLTNAGNPELRGVSSFDSGIGEIITLETQYFLNLGSFTPNEVAAATYLNNNAIGPNTPPQIVTILNTIAGDSPAQQAAFLDQVSPQAYGGLADGAFQNSTFLSEEVFNQLEQVFENGGFNTSGLIMLKTTDQDPFAVSMDAAMASAQQQAQNSAVYLDALGMPGAGPEVPAQESPTSGFSGFVLGTITVDQLPENSGFPEQHFTTGSVLAGLDYRLNPNLVVGAMFNWGYTGGTMDSYGSRWRSSSYTPGIFASWQKAGFYANALMSYTYNTYKINRNVSSTVATGAPDANQYDADVLAGYYFPVAPGLKIGPAAGVGFTQMNVGGFNETGSPFDLSVSKQHADSLRSLLGAQGQYAFHISRMPLPISINFNAFWQHEFLDSSRNITASFTQLGGSFLYTTPGPSRDAALLGLGASGYLTRNVSLFVNYETQIGNKSQFAQTVMAGVAVNF